MAKKKIKKAAPQEPSVTIIQTEIPAVTTPEMEDEVQYTDTSYTSASFESIQVVQEVPSETRWKKTKASVLRGPSAKKSSLASAKAVSSELLITAKTPSEESVLNLSEETAPVISPIQEERHRKKKKGKKKKGKPVEEEIPVFEKPKTWKKMNKAAREAWQAQMLEEWRIQKEIDKQNYLQSAKERRIQLAKERNELMIRDTAEENIRRDILAKTVKLFKRFEREKMNAVIAKEERIEWIKYRRCDGVPNHRIVPQMSTYIHLWKGDVECTMDNLEKRCADVLPLMEKLDEFIITNKYMAPTQRQNYKEVILTLRTLLADAIQCASYMILRDLQKNLTFESLYKATYEREFKTLSLNIWTAIKTPTRLPRHNEPTPEPLELEFPNIKVGLKLPVAIDRRLVCVRIAHSRVDLKSESCKTFDLVALPNGINEDLFNYNETEYEQVCKLKEEQDKIRENFFKGTHEKIREIEKFMKANPYMKNDKIKEELENLMMAEPPPLTDPRTLLCEQNETAHKEYLRQCLGKIKSSEVNMRKYRICGGVLNIDVLVTPPQPKPVKHGDGSLTTLQQLHKTLVPIKFQVQYRAPGPPPPDVIRTPEEIEAELRKTEAAFERLVLVSIDLPDNVMWTEPPVVCQWYEKRKTWTTDYINDYKFNEDKFTIQFRTGVFWPIGIATLRYSNLPYQGWDMKPDPNGKGVLLSITGVNVTVTWLFHKKNYIKLISIANAPNKALADQFDKPYTSRRMIKLMQEAACDFFPDYDAHNFVEGSYFKDIVTERHMYHAMAFLSKAYNFQWSRWNAGAGSRALIVQIREAISTKREETLRLLKVTPQRAYIMKANEMMQEFDDEPMPGEPFYPDLFTLNMSYGSTDARRSAFNMDPVFTELVYEFLQELKLFSFS